MKRSSEPVNRSILRYSIALSFNVIRCSPNMGDNPGYWRQRTSLFSKNRPLRIQYWVKWFYFLCGYGWRTAETRREIDKRSRAEAKAARELYRAIKARTPKETYTIVCIDCGKKFKR